jgi:signal transduction histidine kinase
MARLRRLSLWVRWGIACGVVLLGVLLTILVEGLLADNALAYSSDARTGFLVIGGAISVALGLLVLVVIRGGTPADGLHEDAHQWRVRSLFWRLFASYFAATFVTALIATYVGRREGPFRVLIGNPVVEWFSRVGANDTNSALLFVVAATVIGTLTGVLVSLNLRRRLQTMAGAALSWSHGDFAARTHDTSRDELGGLARVLNHMAEQIESLVASRQELAVVEERNRLARELHDSVKQQVFANALLVRAARKLIDEDPPKAREYLADAEELAGQTQQELIALIQALRPATLEDRGLVAVLGDYIAEWTHRTGIAAELRAQGERATPLDLEEAFFRVGQEALANAARHSGARHVEVALCWEGEQVRLTVADDGMGFDAAQAEGRGLGLASMRERMTALGGTLAITSTPHGTTVAAEAPFTLPAPAEQVEAVHG